MRSQGLPVKGEKLRYVPLHGVAGDLIDDHLKAAGHGADNASALFRPFRNGRGGGKEKAITSDGVCKLVRKYSALLGFEIGVHTLRATAATNELGHEPDIAKVRSGSVTPTLPRPGSTTTGKRGLKRPNVQDCVLRKSLNLILLLPILVRR